MEGKCCLVTGANAGIGRETCAGLAALGARVLMACRSPERARAAADSIREQLPGADLDVLIADLASLDDVRRLSEQVREKTSRLDVLVSNAGVFSARRRESVDGYELTFAVNHLAPFLLVNSLLDELRSSAPARAVIVASAAHYRGTIDFEDVHAKRRYGGWRAYCQSKLANVLFARQLAARVPADEVTSNAVHPGSVATKLLLRGIVPAWLARPFTITPVEGARTSIWAATSEDVAGVTGGYFDDCRFKEPSAEARDEAVAARLWDLSEQLTAPYA